MGPLGALCTALTLLGALKGQSWWLPRVGAQALKSFQDEQFQGLWFVLGLAGSTHSKADRSLLSPFTATFERSGKRRLQVSYAMTRGPRCITWSYLLTPTAQPGQFSVDNSRGEMGGGREPAWGPAAGGPLTGCTPPEPGALAEELQVHDTDYTTFALMVSKRQSGGQRILRVYLLCRMWAIEVKELDRFVCLLGAQGLSEDNIVFPDPAGDACPVRGAGGTCLRAGAPWVCMAYSWGTCGRGLGATEGSA
ncbi:epididymal-specific lipocalin-12 isoform X5 [Artibeus jamaicensis]|uniref:epididymal-specific lipocalin-12 isoform X5 n=1 Tax=Artibeus jamaicensis TaxID=9417 RepID=UPI00235A9E39|nr:epididymal-specific lipocalin-12 isoform X5 [Artibeus jamaicensis]